MVFFDDILVYSEDWNSHLTHLQLVFEVLVQHRLFVKRTKCAFGAVKIEYLGHVISKGIVSMDASKVAAVADWPTPQSVKELRGFLGLTGYYRRFILNYGSIARPLTELLKKGAFLWNTIADLAFNNLKQAMIKAPVLALPDFTKEFIVESDASHTGIGAILTQGGRPVAYFSKHCQKSIKPCLYMTRK